MSKEEIETLLIKYGVAFSNRVNVREFRGTKQFDIAEDELKRAEKDILDLLSHPESEERVERFTKTEWRAVRDAMNVVIDMFPTMTKRSSYKKILEVAKRMIKQKLVEVDREEKEYKPIGKFVNVKRNKKSISFKIKLDKKNE